MKRIKAILLIGLSYLLAIAAGFFIWKFTHAFIGMLWSLFLADIGATVVIWVFGLIFRNSSFYDPYWSLIPWVMVLFLMCVENLWSGSNILFFAAITLWSWRLTVNWAYTCKDITTQDWRYIKFKAENKAPIWHIINFFGINMVPTLLVFAGLIPAIKLLEANLDFYPAAIAGAAVIVMGTALELFADLQMHAFLRNNEQKIVMDKGLWKYSRHPNYLGEITVWLGVYVSMLTALPSMWFLGFGFILMILLFSCISIPMMEKRQSARRPDYIIYQRHTSMLLLLPRKKKKES